MPSGLEIGKHRRRARAAEKAERLDDHAELTRRIVGTTERRAKGERHRQRARRADALRNPSNERDADRRNAALLERAG